MGIIKTFSQEREKNRQEVNNWIRNTKSEEGGFDYFFYFDKIIRDPNDQTIIYSDYGKKDGLHPSPKGHEIIVEAIDNLEIFNKDLKFENNHNKIKLNGKTGIKFKLEYNILKGEEIFINIKGISDGSNGFSVLTNNKEGKQTSDYYETGKIVKGKFENINIKIKVNEESNYIIIKNPINYINIDHIILESIEVLSKEHKKNFKIEDGIVF